MIGEKIPPPQTNFEADFVDNEDKRCETSSDEGSLERWKSSAVVEVLSPVSCMLSPKPPFIFVVCVPTVEALEAGFGGTRLDFFYPRGVLLYYHPCDTVYVCGKVWRGDVVVVVVVGIVGTGSKHAGRPLSDPLD